MDKIKKIFLQNKLFLYFNLFKNHWSRKSFLMIGKGGFLISGCLSGNIDRVAQ
jgi:hypothetical protein